MAFVKSSTRPARSSSVSSTVPELFSKYVPDIVLVVDVSSKNLPVHYEHAEHFIYHFIQRFDVGAKKTRFALVVSDSSMKH